MCISTTKLLKQENCRFILFMCVCFLMPLTGRAQSGGIDGDPGDLGTGGNNTIQGVVYGPSGSRLNQTVKIRLFSVGFGEKFAFSDDSGAFIFRRLRPGSYTITVEGGERFATTQERVDLTPTAIRRGDGITQQVQITLNERSTANSRAAVVNARLAGIPEPAAKLYLQAMSLVEQKPKEALGLIDKALAEFSAFPLALAWQGWLRMQLNEPREAEVSLRKAVNLAPELYEARFFAGILSVKQRNYKDAVKDLSAAANINKEAVIPKIYLGRALVGVKDLVQAETILLEALKTTSTESAAAHRYLGALYNEKGESAKAVTHLEKYLELVPKDKDAAQIRQIIGDLKAGMRNKD